MPSLSPAELDARLRLHLLPELGPRRWQRLLGAFANAASALSAPASAWRSLGLPAGCAEARRSDAVRERASDRLPDGSAGQHDSVALRVSDHPLVARLCALTGPLVSTSANPAGRPAARSRLRVEQYFPGQLDAVLNGPLGGRRNPSTIRDVRSGEVIRAS
ncbi:Threonylcarbamoyl-AMP synthase [Stutzerimonas stutzeri]